MFRELRLLRFTLAAEFRQELPPIETLYDDHSIF